MRGHPRTTIQTAAKQELNPSSTAHARGHRPFGLTPVNFQCLKPFHRKKPDANNTAGGTVKADIPKRPPIQDCMLYSFADCTTGTAAKIITAGAHHATRIKTAAFRKFVLEIRVNPALHLPHR